MRRFVIMGNRAISSGKLKLNDLASAGGRMDVIVRAIMSSLLLSHGIRKDCEVIIHLLGGPGPSRRIKFVGSEITGLHAEERSVAGQIAKIIREPLPPIGVWKKCSDGIYDSGGSIENTLAELTDSRIIILDADGENLVSEQKNSPSCDDITFVVSDDKPLEISNPENHIRRSLGNTWLQGHIAIGICHYLLDEKFSLNLN